MLLDQLKTVDDLPGLSELELFAGYSFKCRDRILEALTHASYANENSLPYCNERLEFLGDSVLQLCVSSLLFRWFPEDDEGALSSRRAALVCGDSLSDWAVDSGIPSLLRLGKGLARSGGFQQPVLLANAAEAVFGAVFLDGGYSAAEEVIAAYCGRILVAGFDAPMNPKASLQEFMEKNLLGKPEYLLIDKRGPAHAPLFRVTVRCGEQVIGTGDGRTLKEAERKAAEKGLKKLEE